MLNYFFSSMYNYMNRQLPIAEMLCKLDNHLSIYELTSQVENDKAGKTTCLEMVSLSESLSVCESHPSLSSLCA